MKKYRTEAEDVSLGLEMYKVESEPYEARIYFWLQQSSYPQVNASIELRDGLDRHWLGESDSFPICNGWGKYLAIQWLKHALKKRYPTIQVVKCDYSEIKNYHPAYLLEYKWYRDRTWTSLPRYEWVGTWLPL